MKGLKEQVRQFIVANQLLGKNQKYLVALSGGADSVCLLNLCLELGYDIEAVHCNFHLRGKESDRDELFCETLCKDKNIPFHRAHFNTKAYAALHKVSIEMAARELRYSYFEQLRKDINASAILVAHHLDDVVETVLINLVRGTGIHGLQGIKARQHHIVRPLLEVSRCDILAYLDTIRQDYVTDSSNMVDDVQRNKLRLNIIPLLKNFNPAASKNIAKTAKRISMAAQIFDEAIECKMAKVVTRSNKEETRLSIQALKQDIAPEYLLFEVLRTRSFSPNQVEQIALNLEASPGARWESATHVLLIDREEIVIQPRKKEQGHDLRIPDVGNYIFDEVRRFKFAIFPKPVDFIPSKDNDVVTLDADKVQFPLTIRHAQTGDKFFPFGMKGSKLISDYLTDLKLNCFEKQSQLIIVDAAGKVIYIVGKRVDDRCRISQDTANILRIKFHTE